MIRRRVPLPRNVVPLKRTAIKQSRKRIAQRSEKTIAKLPDRVAAVDAAWERDRGQCRARAIVAHVQCGGPLDPHEIIPRSAWAAGQYDVDNILIVCRRHHEWIGDFPEAAHTLGLHRFSWERS